MAGSEDGLADRIEIGGEDGGGRSKKRTCRGQRKRRSGNQWDGDDQEATVAVPSQRRADQGLDRAMGRPRRIIKHTRMVLQAEDNLRRAMIITVIDQSNSGCAADVSDSLAVRFNLDAQTLDLRRAAPNSYVAFLPNEEVACRVFSGSKPFVSPTVRLHIKRWSRQAMAIGGEALIVPDDIELRGIPAHLWGLETTVQLLDDHCLIRDVHPDSAEGIDLSIIKLSAWCDEPELVPAELDLLAEEPQMSASEIDPCPRTLVFPISVRVSRLDVFLGRSSSPPPPPTFFGGNREQDHDKRRRNPRSSLMAVVRRPVHARLGPCVHAGSVPGGAIETVALSVPLEAETAALVSHARFGPCVRAGDAPGGTGETVALQVPFEAEAAALDSPPLARLGPCAQAGSASGEASVTVAILGPLGTEEAVGAEDAASGSSNPAPNPSVSPPPAFVPSIEAPQAAAALISTQPTEGPVIPSDLKDSGEQAVGDSLETALSDNPHGTSSKMTVIEEFGDYPRIDQCPESHCANVSGRVSVTIRQDPVVRVVNAAKEASLNGSSNLEELIPAVKELNMGAMIEASEDNVESNGRRHEQACMVEAGASGLSGGCPSHSPCQYHLPPLHP
jgi:hypothetical protein